MDHEAWHPWYRLEGLTVFFGTTEANEGAVLVSFIARAPPKLLAYVRSLPLSYGAKRRVLPRHTGLLVTGGYVGGRCRAGATLLLYSETLPCYSSMFRLDINPEAPFPRRNHCMTAATSGRVSCKKLGADRQL